MSAGPPVASEMAPAIPLDRSHAPASVPPPSATPAAASVTGGTAAEAPVDPSDPLRIALLVYRGNPRCGGQGVYVRHLSRALARQGHQVEVISGPPYPEVDPGVALTPLPSLDLYRPDDPFRIPRLREFRDAIDLFEFALMCTGGFPEPLTFSLRAWRHLARRRSDFDIVHDNQGLGYGLLGVQRLGLPVIATVHHPIAVDRQLDLAHAGSWRRRLGLRRWYGFTRMQNRVARRLPRILTVSEASRRDIVRTMGVASERLFVVPLGVDTHRFRPLPAVAPVPGRILTTTSADVPLKGLVTLVRAMPLVRRRHPHAHLVVVGEPRPDGSVARTVAALDLGDVVRFTGGVSEERLVELYAEAEVAAVPSLYEGFSLPAVEAMACGTALVATTGGALPEVTGTDGETCLLVPPGDHERLAAAVCRALDDPAQRRRLGRAARQRVLELFSWEAAAQRTVTHYREVVVRC